MRQRADKIFSSKMEYTKSCANQFMVMKETDAWKHLQEQWFYVRENIIREGKKARSEEGRVFFWAMLDGFDKATQVVDIVIDKANAKKELTMAED